MAEFNQSVGVNGDLTVSGTLSIGGATPLIVSETLALSHDASASTAISFTENSGAVMILVEGQGDGGSGNGADKHDDVDCCVLRL